MAGRMTNTNWGNNSRDREVISAGKNQLEFVGTKIPFPFYDQNLPYALVVTPDGNTMVVYWRERGGDPYGDTESFFVQLVPARTRRVG